MSITLIVDGSQMWAGEPPPHWRLGGWVGGWVWQPSFLSRPPPPSTPPDPHPIHTPPLSPTLTQFPTPYGTCVTQWAGCTVTMTSTLVTTNTGGKLPPPQTSVGLNQVSDFSWPNNYQINSQQTNNPNKNHKRMGTSVACYHDGAWSPGAPGNTLVEKKCDVSTSQLGK